MTEIQIHGGSSRCGKNFVAENLSNTFALEGIQNKIVETTHISRGLNLFFEISHFAIKNKFSVPWGILPMWKALYQCNFVLVMFSLLFLYNLLTTNWIHWAIYLFLLYNLNDLGIIVSTQWHWHNSVSQTSG